MMRLNLLKNTKLPLKNRLTYFFLSITLISVILFTWFMYVSFDSGLEKSTKLRLISEFNGFARDYENDRNTSFKNSYIIHFYFDKLPNLSLEGIPIFDSLILNDDEFEAVFGNDLLPNSDKNEPIYVVYTNKLHDNRQLYVMAKYDIKLVGDDFDDFQENQIQFILQISFSYLILSILALWYYSRIIGKKTEELVKWAEKTSQHFYQTSTPDFKFNEFNRIAECLNRSLTTNAALIDKEKRFLSHASHELRTPIATIRANIEIFEKMPIPEMAKSPLARLDRASINMQLITETLLWLARQSDCKLALSQVNVTQLLARLIDEQQYLIQGEEVEVIKSLGLNTLLSLPESPLMIVLNNLIRNAFQYTHQGWIKVSYSDNHIIIENKNAEHQNENTIDSFGLGLELTQRICQKLNWKLEISFQQGGVLARLQLPETRI